MLCYTKNNLIMNLNIYSCLPMQRYGIFFIWPTKKIPSNMNFISICRFAMICIEKAKTTVYNDTKIPNCRCNSGYIWVILFNTIYL